MQIRFRHVIAGLTSVVAALARAAGAQAASSPRKGNAGTVSLRVKCNQAGKVKLTGTLTQPIGAKRGHGKQKSKRYKLAPLSGSARAGRMLTLTVKLPAAGAHRPRPRSQGVGDVHGDAGRGCLGDDEGRDVEGNPMTALASRCNPGRDVAPGFSDTPTGKDSTANSELLPYEAETLPPIIARQRRAVQARCRRQRPRRPACADRAAAASGLVAAPPARVHPGRPVALSAPRGAVTGPGAPPRLAA